MDAKMTRWASWIARATIGLGSIGSVSAQHPENSPAPAIFTELSLAEAQREARSSGKMVVLITSIDSPLPDHARAMWEAPSVRQWAIANTIIVCDEYESDGVTGEGRDSLTPDSPGSHARMPLLRLYLPTGRCIYAMQPSRLNSLIGLLQDVLQGGDGGAYGGQNCGWDHATLVAVRRDTADRQSFQWMLDTRDYVGCRTFLIDILTSAEPMSIKKLWIEKQVRLLASQDVGSREYFFQFAITLVPPLRSGPATPEAWQLFLWIADVLGCLDRALVHCESHSLVFALDPSDVNGIPVPLKATAEAYRVVFDNGMMDSWSHLFPSLDHYAEMLAVELNGLGRMQSTEHRYTHAARVVSVMSAIGHRDEAEALAIALVQSYWHER